MTTRPTTFEVQSWLEWAGERLLTLQVSGTKPQSYRSFWPDYPDDPFTAFGYTDEIIKTIPPSAEGVSLADKISDLILLISASDVRRIVQLRSLISPTRNNHIYSWSLIAKKLHSERRLVKWKYNRGLIFIVNKARPSEIEFIRSQFR